MSSLLAWSAIAAMGTLLVVISHNDIKTHRILNGHNVILLMLGLGYALLSKKGLLYAFLGSVAGGGFLLLVRWIYGLRGQVEGLGLGDVKFMIAAGAWVGWQGVAPMLVVAALSGLLFALLAHFAGRLRLEAGLALPFGPFLALGLFVVFAMQEYGIAPWLWLPDTRP